MPKLARRFVGRNPGKRLDDHPLESWHQAVVYALSGQREALVRLMQAHALFVAAGYPRFSRYMGETAQVYRW